MLVIRPKRRSHVCVCHGRISAPGQSSLEGALLVLRAAKDVFLLDVHHCCLSVENSCLTCPDLRWSQAEEPDELSEELRQKLTKLGFSVLFVHIFCFMLQGLSIARLIKKTSSLRQFL